MVKNVGKPESSEYSIDSLPSVKSRTSSHTRSTKSPEKNKRHVEKTSSDTRKKRAPFSPETSIDNLTDYIDHKRHKATDSETVTKSDRQVKTNKTTKSATNPKRKANKTQSQSMTGMDEFEKLMAFMNKYRNRKKGSPYTHTFVSSPYGSYNIPDDMYKKFLKLYENAVVAGYEPYITERHKEFGPIIVDIDFVQAPENPDRHYTDKTITNVIKIYNKIIKKYLSVSNKDLTAYVTEKEKPSLRNKEYHDGFHIVYPYICTKPVVQMLIREDVIHLLKAMHVFKRVPYTNTIEDMVDKKVIYDTGWLLYGSRKNSTYKAYRVTHIYNTKNICDVKKINKTKKLAEKDVLYDIIVSKENLGSRAYIKHFVDVLSVRRFWSQDEITPFNDNVDLEKLETKVGKIKERTKMESGGDHLLNGDTHFINATTEVQLVEAKNLAELFSVERATNTHSWLQVGACLYNIDYRLLDTWIKFSKKCPEKFKPGECERIWKKMRSSGYGMASLHYYARTDNPDLYTKMNEIKLKPLIREALEGSHTTIARLLMHKYKFRFKCASIKQNLWYEFKNHRWVVTDSGHSLRLLISTDIRNELLQYQRNQYTKVEKGDKKGDEDDRDDDAGANDRKQRKRVEKGLLIAKVIKKLNDSNFKNGVIRDCADMALDENFLKNLDENHYLLCFENGVYDLETGVFRPGCPDDCISLCTGYRYLEYDENDEYAIEINDFLNKIQPDPVMREYLIKLMSTCVAGSICEESFYVLTGSGANGKSKLMELLKYTLGNYFKPMDIRILTEKRSSSSSASPELADKKGVRACPFDEPKSTDEINTGFMKIFTGGDEITARALFKDPIYFKPQFKPFLLCNKPPLIKADDEGTWRRLKVIPFLSKFINRNDATKKQLKKGLGKDQFWADERLSEKLKNWAQMFMGLLLKYYAIYREKGLVHPKLVTQYTDAYRKKCDIFQDFMGDYLDKTGDPAHTLSIISLHKNMRNWHKINFEGRAPNIKEMREYMRQRVQGFDEKLDSLTGYIIKKFDDDLEDNLEGLI